MSNPALSGKVFSLITGASRGIGRQIAISFSALLEEGSHVLLLATNLNALKDTAAQLPSKLSIDYASIDLGTATKDQLEGLISASIKKCSTKKFDRVVVVHNVGTMGDISKWTKDMTDIDEWRKYYDLNMFIPVILNGVVMQLFGNQKDTKMLIINVTSLLATMPEKSLGFYCSVKAAKEIFFKVFALENPEIDVLNYSPGPVSTDMFDYLRNESADKNVQNIYNEMASKRTVLTTEQTVNRLLEVLKDHKYKSGDHVDYFDEI